MLLTEILDKMDESSVRVLRERAFEQLSLLVPIEGIATMSFLDNARFVGDVPENLVMLLTTEELVSCSDGLNIGLAVATDPRDLFFRIHNYLSDKDGYKRTTLPTRINPTAQISPLAYVSETNVMIGADVVIEPFVTIYPDTVIGHSSIIRAGGTIGGTGYEFKHTDDSLMAVAHVGGVVIADNVEIQNNTCIDRAIYPWDNTEIGSYTKLDNLVHIAHACKIGKRTMIVANVGLGGRVVIGDDAWIGFGSTIRNGLTIGDRARINMGAVVTRSVGDDESVTGNFAIPHDQFLKLLKRNLQLLEE